MAASGVMVGKPSLCMRVADGVSMITRASCMLGMSGAFKSKQRYTRHRLGATRVPKLIRIVKISEKYRFLQFAFFVSDGFPNLSRSMGDLESSGAGESMQNDLAHLTESARLPIEGCAGS